MDRELRQLVIERLSDREQGAQAGAFISKRAERLAEANAELVQGSAVAEPLGGRMGHYRSFPGSCHSRPADPSESTPMTFRLFAGPHQRDDPVTLRDDQYYRFSPDDQRNRT